MLDGAAVGSPAGADTPTLPFCARVELFDKLGAEIVIVSLAVVQTPLARDMGSIFQFH